MQRLNLLNERRGRVLKTHASYWGGSGFNLSPEQGILSEVFGGFLSPSRQMLG
jgi:hypothetical protein